MHKLNKNEKGLSTIALLIIIVAFMGYVVWWVSNNVQNPQDLGIYKYSTQGLEAQNNAANTVPDAEIVETPQDVDTQTQDIDDALNSIDQSSNEDLSDL